MQFDYGATARTPRAALRFAALLRKRAVRTLYLTDQPTRSIRYLLFRLAGVRHIVVHDRTSGERATRRRTAFFLKRLLHRLPWYSADRFIAVSDFVADRLRRVSGTPAARTIRVYNGIDLARFTRPEGQTLQSALGLPATSRVVFGSGRAMPYKGIEVLIEAARLLEDAGLRDVHVAWAGDGPAFARLAAKAHDVGLQRFHFLGRRDDVPALLASATVAVVPSLWAEAFGLTVVEAMAAGAPVVASATGGIPELIRPEETGLLVPPGDPVALAAAIRRLLDDAALRARLSARGREEAQSRFSLERAAEEISGVLLRLTD
jgi:glycosyltransferase involved in cell wall biosynthesis